MTWVGWSDNSTVSLSLVSKDWSLASVVVCSLVSCDQVRHGIYHHHYYWSASIQLYQVFSSKDNWRWSRLQPVFSNIQSSSFIFIKPVRDGPAGLFSHLAMVNLDNDHEFNNHFITTLTLGTFSVSRILGWDTVRNIM